MKFSDLLIFSAFFWGVVIGSTVNPGIDAAKKLKSSSNSTNLLKENDSVALSGNESDLTIVLPDNNTTQTKLQTDIKASETKVSNINKNLSISHNENKTNKVAPMPVFPTTAPELGKWIIKDDSTNKTCIVAQMKMQLNLTYPGSINKVENATLNGPGKNATAKGSCSNETIIITWSPNHSLEINFENSTGNNFFISSLSVKVNATVLPYVKENISTLTYSSNFSELFETPFNMSYKCGKLQTVNLSSPHSEFQAVVALRDTQFQAFMNNINTDFGVAQDCEIFDTPDIVPIAVGTALAILVVVVLIAYLVGRRRSQNRGYLSM